MPEDRVEERPGQGLTRGAGRSLGCAREHANPPRLALFAVDTVDLRFLDER